MDEPTPSTGDPRPLPDPARDAPGAEARELLDAAPGLARVAAGAWLRTADWAAGAAMRAGRRAARVAIGAESPLDLLRDAGLELTAGAERLLEAAGIDSQLGAARNGAGPPESLRARGQELLERSSELDEQGDVHPAYAQILEQLAPDEARILRLLATTGPQPAIDVRTWRPLDIGSTVVAPGLTMIGQHAGCMHPGRVPAYLSNLFRLGLIWFSRDTLPDPGPYQVLEAQPDVTEALAAARRARVVRRSIHLTPFGGHFCESCLPLRPSA